MVSSADNIKAHSIFRTKDEESVLLKRLKGTGASSYGNLLCARANEVFVAVGNTIRCADISQDPNRGFKNLKLPIAIDFAIKSLVLNEQESILAIVGEDKVAACMLPDIGYITKADHRIIEVRGGLVGYSTTHKSILKVAWNPIARYDANLVVLTSDNVLRAYNLIKSYDEPEYEYDLNAPEHLDNEPRDQVGFGLEEQIDAVSFTFGTDADCHGLFTLYLLTAGGDIYSLCPWLPNTFLLESGQVSRVIDDAVKSHYEYGKVEGTDEAVKDHYKDQLHWASGLWKQMVNALVEVRRVGEDNEREYRVLEKNINDPDPVLQGPFSMLPYPDELYNGNAQDIVSIKTGDSDGSLTVLAVSNSLGRVSFFAQDATIDTRWVGDGLMADLSLAALESVLLTPAGTAQKITLQTDYRDPTAVFAIASSKQGFRLDISTWTVPLTEAMQTGRIEEVDQALQELPGTDVLSLVPARYGNSIAGIATMVDVMGSPFNVVKTGDRALVYVPVSRSSSGLQLVKRDEAPAKDDQTAVKYSSLLTEKPFKGEVEYLLDSIDLSAVPRPQGNISRSEMIKDNLEDMNYLTELCNFYTEEVYKLHQAGMMMYNRLLLQRTELHRQLGKVGELNEKILSLKESNLPDQVRLTVERQTKIHERATELLKKLASVRSLALSAAEKRWFSELSRMRQMVYGSQGIDRRFKNVISQLDIVQTEAKVADRSSSSFGVDASSVTQLRSLLRREDNLISDTKKMLTQLVDDDIASSVSNLTITTN